MLLTPGVPFGADWARAAEKTVEVVTIEVVRDLTLPRVDHRVAAEGGRYQLEAQRIRPSRVFHRPNARSVARGLDRCLQHIEGHIGHVDLLHSHFYSNAEPLL